MPSVYPAPVLIFTVVDFIVIPISRIDLKSIFISTSAVINLFL